MSNENFWHVDAISHLKLRGSFGKVGNDQIGGDRFLYLTTINKNAAGMDLVKVKGGTRGWQKINGYCKYNLGSFEQSKHWCRFKTFQ